MSENKYQNITDFFETSGSEDIERFVDKNLDISTQVYALLKKRGWSQKDLAEALGKTNAEISKWLSGSHNITLRSIAKMEAVLDADIIITPQKAENRYKQIKFVTWKVFATTNQMPEDIPYSKVADNTKAFSGIKTMKVA